MNQKTTEDLIARLDDLGTERLEVGKALMAHTDVILTMLSQMDADATPRTPDDWAAAVAALVATAPPFQLAIIACLAHVLTEGFHQQQGMLELLVREGRSVEDVARQVAEITTESPKKADAVFFPDKGIEA